MFSVEGTTATMSEVDAQLGDRSHRLDHRGAARHVHLHLVHAGRRLDRDAARVEGDRLADDAQHVSRAAARVAERDQARLLDRTPVRRRRARPCPSRRSRRGRGSRRSASRARRRAPAARSARRCRSDVVGRQALKVASAVLSLGRDPGGVEGRPERGRVRGASEDEALQRRRRRIVRIGRAKAVEPVAAQDQALGERGRGFGGSRGRQASSDARSQATLVASAPACLSGDQRRRPPAGAPRVRSSALPRPTIARRAPSSGKATLSFLNAGLASAAPGAVGELRRRGRRPRRSWSREGLREAPRTAFGCASTSMRGRV